jgi:hypothetical protein
LPDDDESRFHVPLEDLTGRHGYALVRGEDDETPPDPGAPVAYVAEQVKDRPSGLTIEGMIAGIGAAAQGAAREGGEAAWLMRLLLVIFVLPVVLMIVGRLSDLL